MIQLYEDHEYALNNNSSFSASGMNYEFAVVFGRYDLNHEDASPSYVTRSTATAGEIHSSKLGLELCERRSHPEGYSLAGY